MTEAEPGSETSFTRSMRRIIDTGQRSNITQQTHISVSVNPKYLTVQNGAVEFRTVNVTIDKMKENEHNLTNHKSNILL